MIVAWSAYVDTTLIVFLFVYVMEICHQWCINWIGHEITVLISFVTTTEMAWLCGWNSRKIQPLCEYHIYIIEEYACYMVRILEHSDWIWPFLQDFYGEFLSKALRRDAQKNANLPPQDDAGYGMGRMPLPPMQGMPLQPLGDMMPPNLMPPAPQALHNRRERAEPVGIDRTLMDITGGARLGNTVFVANVRWRFRWFLNCSW